MRIQNLILKCWLAGVIGVILVMGGVVSCAYAQTVPAPINQIIFKGTHNSYDARRRVPPAVQIDDFGVWAIELDYSIPMENGPRRAVVGHDGPGAAADGEDVIGGDPNPDPRTTGQRFRLEFFLKSVKNTRAFHYRPVFIYFEKKKWTQYLFFPFPHLERLDDPDFDDPTKFLPVVESELRSVFPDAIFGPAQLAVYILQHGGRYPTVPELAGKVIPIAINAPGFVGGSDTIFHDGPCLPPCRSFNLLANIATDCDGIESIPNLIPRNNIIRLDNHQANVSFGFGVPPNPLVVDRAAPPQTRIYGCDGEIDVHQQGTFCFRYSKIGDAITRALGIVPPNDIGRIPPEPDHLRAGIGWTLLIEPGSYPEALTINTPLTLKKFDGSSGIVVIGQQ